MDKVYDIDPNFDFSQILLDNPTPLSGGSYFTKLSVAKGCKNLYIQLPKVTTKQGLMKNSSKTYCDLMFTSANKEVISWFEQFEKTCQDLIIQKKELWFHNNVTDTDVDEMMNPIIRPYKSGKYFLVRTYLKGGKCNVYDENEKIYNLENLTNEDEIIPLINLDGIRFNTKNIQIEINLTQIMVLIPPKEFEKQCLIKLHKSLDNLEKADNLNISPENLEKKDNQNISPENLEKDNRFFKKEDILQEKNILKTESFKEKNLFDLEEVDLQVNNIKDNDIISLKDPSDVYKEIYLAAKKKAYELRKNALDAYLEAKNIKEKYSLFKNNL
jgi:hypothetical protein